MDRALTVKLFIMIKKIKYGEPVYVERKKIPVYAGGHLRDKNYSQHLRLIGYKTVEFIRAVSDGQLKSERTISMQVL